MHMSMRCHVTWNVPCFLFLFNCDTHRVSRGKKSGKKQFKWVFKICKCLQPLDYTLVYIGILHIIIIIIIIIFLFYFSMLKNV
jgi:hypothetical protein